MINFRLLRHLWLFLAVAEERHFGNAARRLGISQPPLTKQIQVLEHALKVKLFDRQPSGVQLTTAGAAILPAVRRFAEQMQRLELSVREATLGHASMLTVGTISSAMFETLPGVIAIARERHPELTLSLKETDTSDAIAALENGDLDLAFVRLDRNVGTIAALPLQRDKLGLALPAGHRLAKRASVKLAELAAEDFVLFPRSISPAYFDNVVSACRQAGFSPRILHEASSVASQLAFVACGQGVAVVPMSLRDMHQGHLKFLRLRDDVDVVTTSIAWNRARANPAVDQIVAIAREWAGVA